MDTSNTSTYVASCASATFRFRVRDASCSSISRLTLECRGSTQQAGQRLGDRMKVRARCAQPSLVSSTEPLGGSDVGCSLWVLRLLRGMTVERVRLR